jgi:spore germination cell wall hydrolase CwlJ-like protein
MMNPINKVAIEMLMALSLSFSGATDQPAPNTSELICLSKNIYFEARAESVQGKMAVANVTKNRVESKNHPNTYCGVVKEGPVRESWKTRKIKDLPKEKRIYYPKKHRCDFSWYCDGQKDIIWIQYMNGTPIEENKTAWHDSVNIALLTMSGKLQDNTGGADHYYNHHIVYPGWALSMKKTAVIGNHTFMKEQR